MASAMRWYSNPSPGCFPAQFMKKPNLPWTVRTAPTITQPMPKAAMRVKKPRMRPRDPANSASITITTSHAGNIFDIPCNVAWKP